MFREMRRFKQQMSESDAIKVLQDCNTAVLGVLGDDGYPYTVPLNFVYKNSKIYFHCAKNGHKTDAIRQNSKVSLCVTHTDRVVPDSLTTLYRSVIVFGKAKILDSENEIIEAAAALCEKYGCEKNVAQNEISKHLRTLCCVEITPEHITGKQSMAFANEKEQ